jgi:hypothetical protein
MFFAVAPCPLLFAISKWGEKNEKENNATQVFSQRNDGSDSSWWIIFAIAE